MKTLDARHRPEARQSLLRCWVLLQLIILTVTAPTAYAFHFPWDQGHDTTDWDDPPPPGPCEGPNCDPCNSSRSPVYVPTGHFIWSDTDIVLPGQPPLMLTRTHNSNDPRPGIFGNGWTQDCEMALLRVVDGEQTRYLLRDVNGKRYDYLPAGDGTFRATAGRYDVVELRDDGGADLIRLDGSRTAFDVAGRVTAKSDANGNAIQINYRDPGFTGARRIESLSDGFGRILSFNYNSGGRVSSITDNNGRTWSYEYDAAGNLVAVTNPLSERRRYEYEGYQPTGDRHIYYRLTRIIDATDTVVTSVSYNGERVSS